jgi:hypothetical protein
VIGTPDPQGPPANRRIDLALISTVADGIDQTALLLEGEHNGRRDYVYIYENEILRSIVEQEFKMHMPVPGVPGSIAPSFNLYREEHPQVGIALWAAAICRLVFHSSTVFRRRQTHHIRSSGTWYCA